MPEIDISKCNGCGLCVSVCQCGALTLINNVASISETEDCTWCLQCDLVCPTGAISCPFEIILEENL